MGEALAGTGKPLVVASGTLSLPKGSLQAEGAEADRNHPMAVREQSGDLVFALAKEKNVRGMVIRLSPTVHGAGDKGFMNMLINSYRQQGSVIYVDDGSARWPAVHREDAAILLRLALEKGAAGASYHGVAEQGVSMKDVGAVMGKKLQLPVQGKSAQEAAETLGFIGHVIALDNPTSSAKTQKDLGWHPTRIGLLADLEENYFS